MWSEENVFFTGTKLSSWWQVASPIVIIRCRCIRSVRGGLLLLSTLPCLAKVAVNLHPGARISGLALAHLGPAVVGDQVEDHLLARLQRDAADLRAPSTHCGDCEGR